MTLRRRLLVILLSSFAITWLLLVAMSYISAQREIERQRDEALGRDVGWVTEHIRSETFELHLLDKLLSRHSGHLPRKSPAG